MYTGMSTVLCFWHQSKISHARANNGLDLVPPPLRIYAAAVVLSIDRLIVCFRKTIECLSARKTANNSRYAMDVCRNSDDHNAENELSSVTNPHPTSLASVASDRVIIGGVSSQENTESGWSNHQNNASVTAGVTGSGQSYESEGVKCFRASINANCK